MSPEFYQREAERCRIRAAEQTDAASQATLRRMATEYDALATQLAGTDFAPNPPDLGLDSSRPESP